jgi:hypothetical protein
VAAEQAVAAGGDRSAAKLADVEWPRLGAMRAVTAMVIFRSRHTALEVIMTSFNTDRSQTLASMDKVEALALATGARVIVQHEVADFAALPRLPAFLN